MNEEQNIVPLAIGGLLVTLAGTFLGILISRRREGLRRLVGILGQSDRAMLLELDAMVASGLLTTGDTPHV